jgi:LacI family transcriptional regulator
MRSSRNRFASRPTLREVAERAGVAVSTASRALNGGSVSDALRTRVVAAAGELEYRPHSQALSLRTGATKTVGFLVSDIANPILGRIVRGAVSYVDAGGYGLLLAVSDGYVERERSLVRMMYERRVDGLILSCSDESDVRLGEIVRELEIPVVLLDRELPVPRAHRVLVDHRQGIVEAVDHLAKLGHRRIGFIGGTLVIRPGRNRYEAFKAATTLHGFWDEDLVQLGPLTPDFGRAAATMLLSAPEPPTALIATDNRQSTGVLVAIQQNGFRMPGQISFVGCGDVEALALHNPPVTILNRPVEEMGIEAAKLLLASLATATTDPIDRPVTRVLSSHLLIRRSTDLVRPAIQTARATG